MSKSSFLMYKVYDPGQPPVLSLSLIFLTCKMCAKRKSQSRVAWLETGDAGPLLQSRHQVGGQPSCRPGREGAGLKDSNSNVCLSCTSGAFQKKRSMEHLLTTTLPVVTDGPIFQ